MTMRPWTSLSRNMRSTFRSRIRGKEKQELAPFMYCVYVQGRAAVNGCLSDLACFEGPIETYVLLDRINRHIAANFRYTVREESGAQTPARTRQIAESSGAIMLTRARMSAIFGAPIPGFTGRFLIWARTRSGICLLSHTRFSFRSGKSITGLPPEDMS
jgi:hypothetical protein